MKILSSCGWLDKNRKKAIGIFFDVRKAFDNIDRSQVLQLIKNFGVEERGIKLLYDLLNNMQLEYKGKMLNYNTRVPQGSVLSPVLFNIVYDVILKEVIAKKWIVLAYADDLFIGVTNSKEYKDVLAG